MSSPFPILPVDQPPDNAFFHPVEMTPMPSIQEEASPTPPPPPVLPRTYKVMDHTPEPHEEPQVLPFFSVRVKMYLQPPGRGPADLQKVQETSVRYVPARRNKWKQVVRIVYEKTTTLAMGEARAHLMTILDEIQKGLTMSTLWGWSSSPPPPVWRPLYVLHPDGHFSGAGSLTTPRGVVSYSYEGHAVKMAGQEESSTAVIPTNRPCIFSPHPRRSSRRRLSSPTIASSRDRNNSYNADTSSSSGEYRRYDLSNPRGNVTRQRRTNIRSAAPLLCLRELWLRCKPTPEEALVMMFLLCIGFLLGILFIVVLVAYCPSWDGCHPYLFPFTRCLATPSNITPDMPTNDTVLKHSS